MGSKNQTHCKAGHEFDLENTHRDKKGKRTCRRCASLRSQDYQIKKRETLLITYQSFGYDKKPNDDSTYRNPPAHTAAKG
jgi:hypothetical protein